ncbi:hypothetical protein SF12_04330 [Streptomyces sp. MBRL 601]|nr:hypothetical protein SF12_04330 [Streptomyces sp. MBRL 601]
MDVGRALDASRVMPRRRATAMLGSLSVATCHSTRRIPRTVNAQSMIARQARVTRPRPTPAGSSQQPASATPCTGSKVRKRTPPTSVPSSQIPYSRPLSAACRSA